MTDTDKKKTDGKVISFINMKGGVGKTTTCKEIGYTLAKNFGKTVLFIDIDPQANLTQSLYEHYSLLTKELYDDLPQDKKADITVSNKTIGSLIDGPEVEPELNEVVQSLEAGLDLIPGDLNTIFLERTNGGAARENSVDNFILNKHLIEKYNYILIDCPPTYSFYTTAALKASDYYIVPVGIDPYSTLGIDLLEKVIQSLQKVDVRRYATKKLQNIGIIFNPMTNTKSSDRQLNLQKKSITESQKLAKYNFYYFSDNFIFNHKFKEDLSYFIMDNGNQKSIANIKLLTKEFIDRIDSLKKENP